MTVISIEPHCFELSQYILDALYGKSRHRPSLPSWPSLQIGKRGHFPALSFPRLTRAHEWQAANDERRRLWVGALAFERFLSECLLRPMDRWLELSPKGASGESIRRQPLHLLLFICSPVFYVQFSEQLGGRSGSKSEG
jgi:hypothetical protein